MNKKSRMYEIDGKRVRTWNPFVGCKFNCNYCYGPEMYKRFSKCEQCKAFVPHFHPERLKQKFKAGETVFVCSMGDISFASSEQFADILATISESPKITYYIQSKDPYYFHTLKNKNYQDNIFLGSTIESNVENQILSKAPTCESRYLAMKMLKHNNKYIVIEPIIQFDLNWMVEWIEEIAPEFVYVGYLNPLRKAKKLQTPEPPLEKTETLIKELKKITEVRLKTIRRAWWEK